MNRLLAVYVKELKKRNFWDNYKEEENISIGGVVCDKNDIDYLIKLLNNQEKRGYDKSTRDDVRAYYNYEKYEYDYYVRNLTDYVTLPNECQVIIADGKGYAILDVFDIENAKGGTYKVLNKNQVLHEDKKGNFEIIDIKSLIGETKLLDENSENIAQIKAGAEKPEQEKC